MNNLTEQTLKRLCFILCLVSIILISGCGDGRPDLEEVIASAIEASDQIHSYRIKMQSQHTEKGKPEQTSIHMEFVAPDRLHTMTVFSGALTSGEEQIRIGTTSYTRENDSNDWNVHDWEDDRLAVRDLAAGTLLSFGELVNVKELDDDVIDGVDCFHYMGSMNMQGQQEDEHASLDESAPHYKQRKQMYESIEYIHDDMEFWIGKDDYLLRQYTVYIETSTYQDRDEDTEEVEHYGSNTTLKFYDYNETIMITAPSVEKTEGVHLTAKMQEVNVGGSDPEHQVMEYEITVVNMGTETAGDLRLYVDTKITNEGLQTFEAKADTMPVNLGRVDNAIYHVNWEFNLLELKKEKFMELIRQNTLRATWTDIDGVQHEEVLIKGEK